MSWRALLASPLGFLVGLSLGALGGGGSVLAVPALVYGAGQDPKAATTTSLLLVGVASAVGIAPHLRGGRVLLGVGVAFGVAGVPGSLAGSALNRHIDPDLLLLGFSGLVLIAAWRMLTACPTCTKVGEQEVLLGAPPAGDGGGVDVLTAVRRSVHVRRIVAIVAAGTAVGFLTGLFGVGGGFVIVPALTLLLGLSMPNAIGTSLVVILVNSVVALTARVATTGIDWAVSLPFLVSAVAGVLVGGHLAGRTDPARSLRWFAALLVAVGLFTGVDAVGALLG